MKKQKLHTVILLGIGLLLITANSFAQDPNFYVYLCFGQSNMEGQGAIQSQDRTVDSRFQVMQAISCSNLGRTKGAWYPAVPPTCQCWSGLSPADYFGRTMVSNLPDSITVGVINVAIGGCDIRLFDKDIYEDYDSTYVESWFLDKIEAYEGNPYQYLIDLAQLAQQDGVIKGILLHQGETNTGNSQWPSYVNKIYNDMLTDLSLSADSVPLLAGELLSAEGNCCSSMNTIINRLPETITTAYVISSSGCTGQDNAHFDSEGYRELGRRYAATMLSLMGYEVSGVNDLKKNNDSFTLEQNYPNPFNPVTNIHFQISKPSHVEISVYDINGRFLDTIYNRETGAGSHSILWDASEFSSGSYLINLESDGFTKSLKCSLVK
ncbi:T9SS type A sorting domain-containing protein [candidate division KSB1 bacterium]|nr:T9SS type A sorting domain-containing protein [candidate division KSB1 bacterium]